MIRFVIRPVIGGRLLAIALAACAVLLAAMPGRAQSCLAQPGEGESLTYSSQQIATAQRHDLMASGSVTLARCRGVNESGFVRRRPNYTLRFNQAEAMSGLELRVVGTCDTVLLVRDPQGRIHFDNDTDGSDPVLRLENAVSGDYDIWAGTADPGSCRAVLVFQSLGAEGQQGPQPRPAHPPICPESGVSGERVAYSSDQLQDGRLARVQAGGAVSLETCAGMTGTGHVPRQANFTLTLTESDRGYGHLYLWLDGVCDTVLLVRGPNGQWQFDDNTDGDRPRVAFRAPEPGDYAIWAGTVDAAICAADLIVTTYSSGFDRANRRLPQQIQLPLGPRSATDGEVPEYCPAPGLDGQALDFGAQQLRDAQRFDTVARGGLELERCGRVSGLGRVNRRPDFTMTLSANPGHDALEIQVDARCDPVLVVNGPDGVWFVSDGSAWPTARLRFEDAQAGLYDIWVGQTDRGTCQATLRVQSIGAPAPSRPSGSKRTGPETG